MVSKEYSEAIVEVLDILKYSEDDIINKIPKNLINFWQENKSETYKCSLDHNKPITEMNLKNKTRAIIAMIYLNYLCDGSERKELQLKLKKNEEELRKKYNMDNTFKRRATKIDKSINEEKKYICMIEYKESFFKKIINKIKKIFKRNY